MAGFRRRVVWGSWHKHERAPYHNSGSWVRQREYNPASGCRRRFFGSAAAFQAKLIRACVCVTCLSAERWLSGRKRRFAKPLGGVNLPPGFESRPLRHPWAVAPRPVVQPTCGERAKSYPDVRKRFGAIPSRFTRRAITRSEMPKARATFARQRLWITFLGEFSGVFSGDFWEATGPGASARADFSADGVLLVRWASANFDFFRGFFTFLARFLPVFGPYFALFPSMSCAYLYVHNFPRTRVSRIGREKSRI